MILRGDPSFFMVTSILLNHFTGETEVRLGLEVVGGQQAEGGDPGGQGGVGGVGLLLPLNARHREGEGGGGPQLRVAQLEVERSVRLPQLFQRVQDREKICPLLLTRIRTFSPGLENNDTLKC